MKNANKEIKITEKKEVAVTERESRKQRIEAICNHLLKNREAKDALLKQEQALSERQDTLSDRNVDLRRELVDKLLYKQVDGEKERIGDDDSFFDVVMNCGLTEEDIDDIVEDMHY